MRSFWVVALVPLFSVMLLMPGVSSAEPIKWDTPIEWTPWEQAEAKAKAENKPICLVVYADWCPKCRKIAPFFKQQNMLDASKRAVMVLQNDEEKPGWLTDKFGDSGNYVPRIFFLDKNGAIDKDINSGHARFPFFYRPNEEGINKLVAAIDQAVTKVGGPAQVAPPTPAAPPANVPAAAPAPLQPAAPPDEPSDLPILLGLVVVAVGAVWFVGRNG